MKIKSAVFVKSITGTDPILYDGLFQVFFLGRSNTGKSTLINSLTARNNLVRSSSSPGKTDRMDFFLINGSFYFVDFPGYGYARHSFLKREKLAKMVLWYLLYSGVKNRLAVLVLDAKVGITPFDTDILIALEKNQIQHILVANKIDNLKMGQKDKQLMKIKQESQNIQVVPYSSKEKRQSLDLMRTICAYIK